MTKAQEVTCIVCPIGCKIIVKTDGAKLSVCEGHKCKKGIDYAKHEALDPRRMLTSSVFVRGGEWPLVSVKTSQPVPKDKVFLVLEEIKKAETVAPVTSGQLLIRNVAKTGINIVATKPIEKRLK